MALLGLVLGSFYNVCIYRLPKGESVLWPPSHCPKCGRHLTPVELVPVVGHLILKGRCRGCRAPIGVQYPLVELLAMGLALLAFHQYGLTGAALRLLLLGSLVLVTAVVDLRHQVIPNALVVVGLVLAVILQVVFPDLSWSRVLLGFAVGGGFLALVAVVTRGGMGGGDVKFGAVLGFLVGWPHVVPALLIAFVSGAAAGIVLMALKLKSRKDFVPFGPFLGLGAVVAFLWGRELITWYLGCFLP